MVNARNVAPAKKRNVDNWTDCMYFERKYVRLVVHKKRIRLKQKWRIKRAEATMQKTWEVLNRKIKEEDTLI